MGLAATAAVLVVYCLGGLDWVELKTLDLRFLYANSIPENDQIVCIDIDDAALDTVGRWPWPRDVQGGVVDVLAEAGVQTLLMDITLREPQTLRSITPLQADMARDAVALASAGEGLSIALPDLELRAALGDVGRVYLATDYATGDTRSGESWKDFLASDDFAEIVVAVKGEDAEGARRLVAGLRPRKLAAGGPKWAPLLWAELVNALEREPTLGDAGLVERFEEAAREEVLAAAGACRGVALRRGIRGWLDEQEGRWREPPSVLFEGLGGRLIRQSPRFLELLSVSLREVLSCQATMQAELVPLEDVAAVAPEVDAVSPVYYLHARVARRCGFVVFDPDSDGIMRRTPLMVQHGGRVLPQLAFAVAFDALGLEVVEAERGRLVLRRADGGEALEIQLDERGRVLVPWVSRRDWSQQFGKHVSIAAAWEVFDRRQKVLSNYVELLTLLGRLVEAGMLPAGGQYCEDVSTRLRLEDARRLARYAGDRAEAERQAGLIAQCDEFVTEAAGALRAEVEAAVQALVAIPADERDDAQVERLRVLQKVGRTLAAHDEYAEEIETTLNRLRGHVAGKIGAIGYTATALADMTPIPTHPRAPGVVAHANLLSGLLSGRMVYEAPVWLNVLLAGLLGVAATVMSVRYGPRLAALVAVLVIAYVGVAGWLVFYVSTYWVALTPGMGTLAASYVAVLAYRYLFLERERRQLTTALSQYTSATLARKMSEDAELCKRAETREVTAVFTDLAGFTTISERIGAERTQHVLNVSLGRFSDVMLRYEGMINKFIGDGIFAFWNPVIYPQPDHARRACETAVELMAALQALVAEQRADGGDEVFGELKLRVGVATGNAVVGPCGSEQKYDYTCIGDTVNVASRLESANKFYGTRILVSGSTLDQTGGRFAVRSLGDVQVKGKTRGVPIYELLGRQGTVGDEDLRYAERFGEAVAAFQRRDWAAALAGFEASARERAADLAARRYAEATSRFMEQGPPEEWNGALELAEK